LFVRRDIVEIINLRIHDDVTIIIIEKIKSNLNFKRKVFNKQFLVFHINSIKKPFEKSFKESEKLYYAKHSLYIFSMVL
jgi:hypothetical protein